MIKLRTTLILFFSITFLAANAQYIGQDADKLSVQAKAPVKAYSFKLQDVKLLDSRFKENMERNGSWLLRMDLQRLLHSWRVNAGIYSQARPLGGWEALDCDVRGHTMGHVLSGFALMYASTGDIVYKKKGDSLVIALADCQRILKQDGYLSAFPQNLIDRCIAGENVWAPWYTIHKIMAGLTDMYLYTGNKQALEVATKLSGWAYRKLHLLTPEQLATNMKIEFGGMIEIGYNLYAITGNHEDLELANFFYDHKVLDPLANNTDQLAKLHANTQIPKIIGEARGYELTGDQRQKTIASFFWQTVHDHHTYANGGNSDSEAFFAPDQLSAHLSALTTETCNTYNMLKLTRHLFSWTADVRYADYYEQALYNHILAAQDPETGMASYHMPFKPGLFKVYSTEDNSFWCCVATAFESNAKFAEAIYYHDDKGVYINLFIPSELNWEEKGVKITQETNYPENATTRFTIQTKEEIKMPLYVRYPSWATNGAIVKVNGKNRSVKQKEGSYIIIDKSWKTGDKIEVSFPMTLRLVATNDDPKKAAIVYGPIVLAGKMGNEGIAKPAPYAAGNQTEYANYNIPASIISTLNTHGNKVTDWLKRVEGQPLTFKTEGAANRPITMIPYYQLQGERYVLYWDLQ
jgi:DUF1680 family protein